MTEWEKVSELLQVGTIDGWAVIGSNGKPECAYGSLEKPFSGPCSSQAQQIFAVFSSLSPVQHFDIAEHRLFVVRQEDSFIHAVSKQRQASISLHYLRSGVLVVMYNAAQHRAVTTVLAAIHPRIVGQPIMDVTYAPPRAQMKQPSIPRVYKV